MRPTSAEEASRLLAEASRAGEAVRITGAGSRPWGAPVRTRGQSPGSHELSTLALDGVVEHNAGDFTAVLQAGVRVADAQARFAAAGQRLALDAPDRGGTIGGLVATGDSGPLRHRYGGPRDLVLGVQVVLSDGTIARAGGKVIKNVAGYDLAKLNTGAFGTLGLLTEVAVRLHPLPAATATLRVEGDADAVARAASLLARARIETEALDVRYEDGRGAVLAQYAGTRATDLAASARELAGGGVVEDDDVLWERQRAAQRDALVVRVSGRASRLRDALAATDAAAGRLVGRAALGLWWVALPTSDAIAPLRAALAPMPVTVLDAPAEVRASIDVWAGPQGRELELMRAVKARFDPAGACNPGTFVGGI
jgi:glycolate oxidase FAD binding subunit